METDEILDIPEFRKHLQEMQAAFKEGMMQDDEHPAELENLVAAMGRLEKELAHEKSQQILSDFFMVFSFIQAFNEDSEDEEDEDFEFDEDEEEE